MIEPLAMPLVDRPEPRSRRLVMRTALLRRLCGADDVPVVSIVAPAGYGKTTLLGQWAERDARRCEWLEPDEDFDAVEAGPRRLVIVDDAHRAPAPEQLHRLLERAPPGTTVALAGRAEPPRLLPRLRAQGRLLELGMDDLALTLRETRSLLRHAGVLLPDGDVSELARRTEGWPALLYLAALSLRKGLSTHEFAGDDRFVADYLESEHLAVLSPAQRRFAAHTSILEELTAEACDDLLGRSDSARVLDALEQKGVVVPLDHRRCRYRLRHLVRDVLRIELERSEPRRVRSLHRTASAWCEAHERTEEALRHAVAAGERARAASLATQLVLPAWGEGRFADAERVLSLVADDPAVERQPDLCVAASWLHAVRARPGESRRWADRAARALGGNDPRLRLLHAFRCRDGADQMLDDAAAAYPALSADGRWRPAATLLRGVARLLAGDTDRAQRDLDDAVTASVDAGAGHLRLLALCLAGVPLDASGTAAREPSTVALLLHGASALDALREGDRGRAVEAAGRADELLPYLTHAVPWLSALAALELVRVRLGFGDADGARELLRRVGDVLHVRPRLGVIVDRVAELDRRTRALAEPEGRWASSLTPAELRLLPLLATHLSFREIGERLFVSRNTVKTQAISIYRKLGVSSRSDALDRAAALGLVDEDAVHPVRTMRPDATRSDLRAAPLITGGDSPWRI